MQRVCGTKQIWEILAFTGWFQPDTLRKALRENAGQQQDPEQETQDADQEQQEAYKRQRRLLRNGKAEARARYREALRLAQQRDNHSDRLRDAAQLVQQAGTSEGPPWFNSHQRNLLSRYDSGELREEMNKAVTAWGHGSLRSADGRTLDIGGSTGGLSRRIIDDWVEPNWEEFLTQPDTNPSPLS